MKNLFLFLIAVTLLSSCKTIVTPLTTVKVFGIDVGDPRWDDCKDIYTQMYSITVSGDTLPTKRIYNLDCYEGRMKTFADPSTYY